MAATDRKSQVITHAEQNSRGVDIQRH